MRGLLIILGYLNLKLFIAMHAFELPSCFQLEEDICPSPYISYRLHNSQMPFGAVIELDTLNGLNYESSNPLKMIIHGFNSSHLGTPNRELIPELLRIPNITIISVDFEGLVPDPCYTQAIHNARFVGRCIGYFLASSLIGHLTVSDLVHLIGFGMGAHIASFASNYLSQFNLKVAQITALDPAKPMYITSDLTQRLDATDAGFVDVIHSDVFLHGLMQSVGHVDFYPNMGVIQPLCGPIDDFVTHQCYHKRAAQLYAESINSEKVFWSFRCRDLYGFIMGECLPSNEVEQLGYYVRHSARGNYFLMTNQYPPYAKGRDFSNLDRTLYGKTYLGNDLLNKLKELGPGIRNLTSTLGR